MILTAADAIAALVAERDRLREELAAAQKNAARFTFVIDEYALQWCETRVEAIALIDAAMAKEKRDE